MEGRKRGEGEITGRKGGKERWKRDAKDADKPKSLNILLLIIPIDVACSFYTHH